MWKNTNKMLVITELDIPKGFEMIKIVRKYLLNKGG